MRQREASPATPGPLFRTLCVRKGPAGEGLICQSVAGQPVEVNTQFSLIESLEESRLVECMGERDGRFLVCDFRGLKSLF